MAELLVSVRSPDEALLALAGGADLIDVKEPAGGSLGRASDRTRREVLRVVAGRRSVSAALGEWLEDPSFPDLAGLSYVKWGLAGCGPVADWPARLAEAARRLEGRLVAVAYADWRRANAPSPQAVCEFACAHGCGVFLLDTWRKDETRLPDWLALPEVCRLRRQCRQGGVRVALAGRLGVAEIQALQEAEPDWFAVRGAVCSGGSREQAIDLEAIRSLTRLLLSPGQARSPVGAAADPPGEGKFGHFSPLPTADRLPLEVTGSCVPEPATNRTTAPTGSPGTDQSASPSCGS